MAKFVELKYAVMHGREFVMGCKPSRIWIVGRMLEWGEVKDIHIGRDDDNAAWMLARRAFDARASSGKVSHPSAFVWGWGRLSQNLGVITFNVTEGILFFSASDGACADNVRFMDNLAFCVHFVLFWGGEDFAGI